MPNLHELLANAQNGEAMAIIGDEFGLSPGETEAAVTALLPAISTGLKQSTATPEGLGNLFAVMGQDRSLAAMYSDPDVAFTRQGIDSGNNVLSAIFGTPDASRAVAAQAGEFSGITPELLKKLLPVLAGILASGLMGGKSGASTPQTQPMPAPAQPQSGGGELGDILGQIFGRAGAPQTSPQPMPTPQASPGPGGQAFPLPSGSAQGGDILGQILQEFQKGIQEGRIKPVIIGPTQIPAPGAGQGGQPGPVQGGDVLGQILRDMLGGALGGGAAQQQQPGTQAGGQPMNRDLSDMSRQLGVMGGVGEHVFGDRLKAGQDVEQDHLDNIHRILERFR